MGNYISGMTSGIDWTSMVSQMIELERRPITLMENEKDKLGDRKDAWSELNTKLLSLKTAAAALSGADDFDLYTSNTSLSGSTKDVEDFLGYAVGSSASQGSYSLKINNLAQAQKLGSRSFASTGDALNIEGDILINSSVVNIASTDSLSDIRTKINALNSGENPAEVTASIFTSADGEYRLTLTSQKTGADGIDIANASSQDILARLGIADETKNIGNAITNGAQSSIFTSSTQDIKSLLGLNSTLSGDVTIAGQNVSIDLSSDSLQDISDKINALAGVSASIIADTESSDDTTYTLQIDGTQDFVDTDNILQTLGFLRQGHSAVNGLTGATENTANGTTITENTLISDIDGYDAWDDTSSITITGTDHAGSSIGSSVFSITPTSTMGDLLSAVESAYGDQVNAYVDGNGAIVIEDNQSGATGITLNLDAGTSKPFGEFGAAAEVRSREIVAAEDAQITLDGVSISRSSNQITDVIAGVTLDLLNEDDDAEISLNITRDYEGVKKKIEDFITNYNDIISYVNDQHEVTEGEDGTTTTPPLFGDASLSTVKSSIRDVILSEVTGIDSTIDRLSYIGVSIDKYGKLSMDDSEFDETLKTNFTDVVNLFVAQGVSSNSNLDYVGSDKDTKEGSYEVEVTRAATRGSTTGVGFNGTLSGNTTVTITDDSGTAEISLEAGWNISSVVNAINSELSKSYQEVRVGANALYSDALQSSPITEDTTWNSVYDSGGTLAGLSDNDTISFSGQKRNGVVVNSEYTITDVASGTVGDLLTQIENDFGSGYDAYIDDEGRIAIKDTTDGPSSLLLSITPTANLDFGEVGVTGDGAQEGRYSMGISAVNDGGQLKLVTDGYGDSGFTVAVSGGNLGITDGTYEGNDIEGRIRTEGSAEWMTMTGDGQRLSGDDDQDVEGLVVKYTGTTTGTFDFDYIAGVGEKLDNTLYYMTDQFDGYVANKKTNLQTRMENMDSRIDRAEVRLDKRQELLMNKFIMMERLMTQMQGQQSWLSGQINALG